MYIRDECGRFSAACCKIPNILDFANRTRAPARKRFSMKSVRKILIANRGEIAIRVMRAANELGKKTVAIFAEQDKFGLHRFKADEAYRIGNGLGPVAAYLSIEEIIRVAKLSGADAVHPGYGLLSENPALVEACEANGIVFIGPSAKTMRALGDKASARQVAIAAGVPVIPATDVLPDDMTKVRRMADAIGYPLMLKASWGGGGRGMRPILDASELERKVIEGRREAENAFGNGEGYLEKLLLKARHVEVQILGDNYGNIYHLWERDCSIQRRNQKVIERAPAPYLSDAQRLEICNLGVKLCSSVGYRCAGTVEFLMDVETGNFYFIEVNPRVQVEHTVTEEVTGIDIVRAQILLAEGACLADATGAPSQQDIKFNGHAMQCRITTEDPQNNFIPDYGRITAYRAATGMGVRLDGGTAYSGAVVTQYYDSLLEKVTVWAPTIDETVARMDRTLREFRIRGVSTNIAFIENLLRHPTFLNLEYTTKFIDATPELFDFELRRDRATRLLTYLADVSVNGHPEAKALPKPTPGLKAPVVPPVPLDTGTSGIRRILIEQGPQAVADWVSSQRRLLITDTSMRDAHQSLIATRMRSIDMIAIAETYNHDLPNLFSMECWGGATFDVAFRFLKECPWQRLRDLRSKMPNLMTQMLFRASNGVGYTAYPDEVVEGFVRQAAAGGVDVFRIFDSMNSFASMKLAIETVLDENRLCEAAVCYTGDILDERRNKYSLKYYIDLAKDLKSAGTHILGLKDMAGLLKPAAAKILIKALKEETGLPVHFHLHDTSGLGTAAILAASEAGVDIVDCAMDSLSGGTSQPPLGSIVAALQHTPRDTGLDYEAIRKISDYWEGTRQLYKGFEAGLQSPNSEVFLHEMPGGQFTNLKAQSRSLGLEGRWGEVAKAYADVNAMFGDIIKVTPTSKVVGDMALMMVAQGLTRADVENPDVDLTFPESVVNMMMGYLGEPPGGFPEAIRKKVLKGEKPINARPGTLLARTDLVTEKAKASEKLGFELEDEDFYSFLMYPKVFEDYTREHKIYGPVRTLPTLNFFYGMQPGEEISVEIDPGKILEIRLIAIGEPNEDGHVRVFFELNGQPRTIRVTDKSRASKDKTRIKADGKTVGQVGAPMPGLVAAVSVKEGQKVSVGDLLLTMEAMKMEAGIHAEVEGIVRKIYVAAGKEVEAKDLLLEIS
jgi:pyruvate carboxylase